MTSTNQLQTTKGTLKTITILHYAFCATILIFGAFVLFVTENATLNLADTTDIFFYLIPVIAIVMASASSFLFQKNLKQVQEKASLLEKLVHYQTSKIIQFAMIEAPAIFGIVVFSITYNQFYIIVSAVLLTYLIILRPTPRLIKEDLNLNAQQNREFRELLR